MKAKKVMAILLSMCMVAGLAACGSKEEATDTKDDAAKTEAEDEAEDEAEEEAITTTLTVWGPSEDQAAESGEWLQTMCEQFAAEHPNWDITFEYGVCAEGDAKTTVTQDVEGAADVYMFANDNLTALIAANGISKLGGETAETIKATNSQAIIDSVSVDGDVYGLPFTTNTWYMFYDTSVFSEEDIKNLDTMLEKGKVSFPITNSWYIASFYVANGCTLFGEDGTDEAAGIDFSGDKAVAVTNYLVDLVANPNFISDADGAGMSGLRDGSVNAIFSGSWDAASAQEALGENYGVAVLPSITIDGEAKQMKAFLGSKAIGVNPNADNMQVAVALAAFLGSEDSQIAHFDTRGQAPVASSLATNEKIAADPVATAMAKVGAEASICQPVFGMDGYWTAAGSFGAAFLPGAEDQITHDNAAEKTQAFNDQCNGSIVE